MAEDIVLEAAKARIAVLMTENDALKRWALDSDETNDLLRAALDKIISIKDDTLGPRDSGSEPTVGRDHFDRGCRMAFYRCAKIATDVFELLEKGEQNG